MNELVGGCVWVGWLILGKMGNSLIIMCEWMGMIMVSRDVVHEMHGDKEFEERFGWVIVV